MAAPSSKVPMPKISVFRPSARMPFVGAAVVSSAVTGAASASSISIRASPASRARLLISFCKQRRSKSRIFVGVETGSVFHSGSSFSTAARISVVISPRNACLPVSSSYTRQPNAQMSVRLSTALPRACSGLMYAAVPMIVPCIVAAALSVGELEGSSFAASPANAFARPKSSTFTLPSGVTFTFAGFRSR